MRSFDRIVLPLLALAFLPALLGMARVWASVDYYSHGFFVPVVSLWTARSLASGLGARSSDRRGIAVLVLAILAYAIGLGLASVALQGLALVAAVAGAVLEGWGPKGLKKLAFPVAFLLFMVPLPAPVLAPVIVALQVGVSQVAVALLQEVGVPILREGNVLTLPGGETLFVAEACSGITSLVTLVPLGVVLAYFSERSLGRRALIVAAVVPAALLGNLIRVLVTVAAARAWGVARATSGPLHESAGLLTFVFACLLLIGFGSLLRRLGPARPAHA